MDEKLDPESGVDLANQILMALDEVKADPVLSYAALGSAFIQLHQALGHGPDAWIDTTKEMAEIVWEKK